MTEQKINLRHLQAFVKIYELGTLLKAARAIHITQPALTQGLARLEDLLEVRLFDRQHDGMHPSTAARVLYPRARNAQSLIRSRKLTFTHLRAFTALARAGSYADASAATGLARASLHRSVADLEGLLNVKLVQRRGRGVELTPVGSATSRRFRLALNELSAAADEIRSLDGRAVGRVRIGAMPLSRARVLPTAIVAFRKTHPDCRLAIAEGSHAELVEPLRDGEFDFLIGALRTPLPGPDLEQKPLFTDSPVIVARRDHPLARLKKSPNVLALSRFEWCLPARGVPLREGCEKLFLEAGLEPPSVKIECGSVLLIRQVLMHSDCLTVLSPDQVAVELKSGWVTVIGAPPDALQRTIGLIYREDWRPTATQEAFVATLEKACQSGS
ncbi:MAG: LysR substrate-binding domain-containing protein [Gammaproteobacteria bacterium]